MAEACEKAAVGEDGDGNVDSDHSAALSDDESFDLPNNFADNDALEEFVKTPLKTCAIRGWSRDMALRRALHKAFKLGYRFPPEDVSSLSMTVCLKVKFFAVYCLKSH